MKNISILIFLIVFISVGAFIYIKNNTHKEPEFLAISSLTASVDPWQGFILQWEIDDDHAPVSYDIKLSRDNGQTWDNTYTQEIGYCNAIDSVGTVEHPPEGANGLHTLACNASTYAPNFKGTILARVIATDTLNRVSTSIVSIPIDTTQTTSKLLGGTTEKITDPTLFYITQAHTTLAKTDHIYRIDEDLNNDGYKEAIISDSNPESNDGQAGLIWWVFLNNGDNTYSLPKEQDDPVISVNPSAVGYAVFPGDSNKSLISYQPDSVDSGSLVSYSIKDKSIVEKTITIHPQSKDKNLYESLIGDSFKSQDSKVSMQDTTVGIQIQLSQ
jgi:hypothetical protein